MLVTTRSRVDSRGLVTCGLGLVTLKCYELGLVACGLGLITRKFCGLGLATKELAFGLLKMAKFTALKETAGNQHTREKLAWIELLQQQLRRDDKCFIIVKSRHAVNF